MHEIRASAMSWKKAMFRLRAGWIGTHLRLSHRKCQHLHTDSHQLHRAHSVMNVFVLGLWVCFNIPTKHTLSLMYSCCLPLKLICSSFSRCFWGTQRDRQGKVKGSNHGVRGVVSYPLVRVWHAWFVEGGDRVDWSPGIVLAWVCFSMSKPC